VTIGLASLDGRIYHVQTQHYPLVVPEPTREPVPLDVRPTVEVDAR
jgi:hypothetical protein